MRAGRQAWRAITAAAPKSLFEFVGGDTPVLPVMLTNRFGVGCNDALAEHMPEWARNRLGCSALSRSS